MAHLTLTETTTELTYTGINDLEGVSLIILKDADDLDVRSITPLDMAEGQTWQTLKTKLNNLL